MQIQIKVILEQTFLSMKAQRLSFMYLFEAQRRLRESNDSKKIDYKEKMPVLLVHKNDFQQLISKDFSDFLENTVKKRTWDSENSNGAALKFDRSMHSLSKEAEDDMQNRIIELIQRNII